MKSTINADVVYQLTGQEFDDETGLHNFRARLYDAELGMFYAYDPASQGFSPFGYANNNPVIYIDKDGKWFFEVLSIASKIYSYFTMVTSAVSSVNCLVHGDFSGFSQGVVSTGSALIVGNFAASFSGLGGFAGGAIAGATGTAISNLVNGENISHNLFQSAIFSGIGNYISNLGAIESAQSGNDFAADHPGNVDDGIIKFISTEEFGYNEGKNGLTSITGHFVPEGWKIDDRGIYIQNLNLIEAMFKNPVKATALTVSDPIKNNNWSKVYISPNAQGNNEFLRISIAHELVHVQQNFDGLYNSYYQESAAWKRVVNYTKSKGWTDWYDKAFRIYRQQHFSNYYDYRYQWHGR